MDLRVHAGQLVEGLAGRIGASPYDVAWMARIPANGDNGARWPDLVDWLLEHQWPDGSWGGTIRYHHDRILCTLAAIIALRERGIDIATARAIQWGEQYIWSCLHLLHHDPVELVGFELMLPTLLARARTLGLNVPGHSYGYGELRAAKLRLLPADMFYVPGTSVSFSIEFLGAQGDQSRLSRLQGPHGAIANSPATTAYLVLQSGGNHSAMAYLEDVKARPGGIPAFYPFRTFEAAWVLEHLAFGGASIPSDALMQLPAWEWLQSGLDGQGAGIDPLFGICDGDTTSVTVYILLLNGQSVDPGILRRFEDPKTRIFRTFEFERNASVVTNAHALQVLSLMLDYPDRREVWNRIVTMLLANQHYRSFWVDKWHASPYYATAHVLVALMDAQEPLLSECQYSIDWLLHTQRADGSWGYFGQGTAEETAYAVLALLHYHRQAKAIDVEALRRAGEYLQPIIHDAGHEYPELWIAKTLYAPESIVRSAILAAAMLYEETLGW